MPNLTITSGGGDAEKNYNRVDGKILVTGTKDAGASVTVTLDPGGSPTTAREDPADPTKWSIRIPTNGLGEFNLDATTTTPQVKDVRQRINVVGP
jgi:hypothetical protein